jgi:hypothetical protein
MSIYRQWHIVEYMLGKIKIENDVLFRGIVVEAKICKQWNIIEYMLHEMKIENSKFFQNILSEAKKNNQWDIVSILIKNGVKVHFDEDKHSFLHSVITTIGKDVKQEEKRYALIRTLLKKSVNPNYGTPEFSENSLPLLHCAVDCQDEKAISLLLEHKADSALLYKNQTVLEYAIHSYHQNKEQKADTPSLLRIVETFNHHPETISTKQKIRRLTQFIDNILEKKPSDVTHEQREILGQYRALLVTNNLENNEHYNFYYYFRDDRIAECLKNIISLLLQNTSRFSFSSTVVGKRALTLLKHDYSTLTENIILPAIFNKDKSVQSLNYDDLRVFASNQEYNLNQSMFFARGASHRFKQLQNYVTQINKTMHLPDAKPIPKIQQRHS